MADDDYANVPSESSMGNYHSQEWGFLKFSDCWRENHGSSVSARVYIYQFGRARGFVIVAMMMLTKPTEGFVRFMHCGVFILRRITPSAQEVELWIWWILKHLCITPFYPAVFSNVLESAHHLSPNRLSPIFYWLYAAVIDTWCTLAVINMETDTCRASVFTLVLMRAARRCGDPWWTGGVLAADFSMSPGGVKCLIMHRKVRINWEKYRDRSRQTNG